MKKILTFIIALVLMLSAFSTMCFATIADDAISVLENAVKNCETTCDLSKFSLDYNQQNVNLIFDDIFLKHPEFFHVDHQSGFKIEYSGNTITKITDISYTCTKAEYNKMLAQLYAVCDSLVNLVKNVSDDYTKALLLHDAIALMCEYDINAAYGHTAYGALVGKKAVCEGYAYAYELLLNKLGIKNELCYSEQLGHEWNVVYIDGIAYHVDITYDDPVPDIYGRVLHDNFMVSTATIQQNDHKATDITNTKPNSQKYEGEVYRSSKSAVLRNGNDNYYVIDGNIYKNLSVIATVDAQWTVGDNAYFSKFVNIAIYNNRLYYNDNKSVYELNLANGNTTRLTTPDIANANIYGMKIDNGNIYIQYSQSFEDSNKSVAVLQTKQITNTTNPFCDVSEGQYYTQPVLWAVQNGITTGTSATAFSPNETCTRAQIVTFLWRAAGSPETTSSNNPFCDVKAGQYYYKAVLWAVQNGITTGTSATAFSPDECCTRAQVVTFLWRAKGKPALNASNPFTDVKTGQYYTDAVLWAVKNNVTNGTSATAFSPDQKCTRAQIVTFLYRA